MKTRSKELTPHAAAALLDVIPTGRKKPEPRPLDTGGALLNPTDAAAFLHCSEWTLASYRCKGTGPRFCKLGNRVRYTPASLAEWIEAHSAASTSEHDMKKAG